MIKADIKAPNENETIEGAKFLKMVNPSIGVDHVEAVVRECETIQHAKNYRRYGNHLGKDQGEGQYQTWDPTELT